MKQTRIFFLLALLISTVAVSGQKGASGGSSPADILYAQPGQLVSVNGFRLNLYCMGSGSPTVVFDSGWGDWAPAWSKVQPEIAKWTRACSYDRAGTGFSDLGPMPRTSVRIAKELHTALHRAGIAGPYILVGSAFGGDNVRTFADLYMDEVAGLVLVDADPDDLEPEAMREEAHRGHAGIPSDLRDCRNLIAEHKPLPAQPSGPGRPQQTCAQQFFFRGLPEAEWSPELNAKVLEIAQTKVAMYDAYSSEMEQTAADETYLQQHRRSFGSRPIRVLTSGNHGVGHLESKPPDTTKHLKYEQETTLAQARWLGLSSNAKQIFARNSSEYIQFDEPETVINAIREVYDQRSARAAGSPGTVFRDCPECPEVVVIPAGKFTMGSSAEEKSWAASQVGSADGVADEAPQHSVSLPSFGIGKYDVTRDEYAAFVRETGHPAGDGCVVDHSPEWKKQADRSWQSPGFNQSDRDPVVCVSWQDAKAYIAWLNSKVQKSSASGGGPYRLPSESEWEYAARAGTSTRFWWGDDDAATPDHAWYKDNSGGQTHPVGLKSANAFGLYDMAGNVWQWTEDCYAETYANAPTDGSANETGVSDPRRDGTKQCMRVDRGGALIFRTWALRSATRERTPADCRDSIMGFRIAKTLAPEARQSQQPPPPRVVDLKATDGTVLKGTYFAAAKPGPGVLLFHQSNRTRKDWNDVATQLAAAGINTLTVDNRGRGESGGKYDEWTEPNKEHAKQQWPADIDTVFQYLASQPGVKRDVIGLGGAGLLGVNSSVQAARRHSAEVKSLVLLSGETFRDGLQFLRESSQLPGLFVVADEDEYPPTVEAMELLYVTSSSPSKKLVHYSAAQEAPWLWYEPVDVGKVPANGGHGTDMFKPHPELPGIIVDWFVTTLIKTPGHAPADTLASAPIINQIRTPSGVAQVTQQLVEARRKDPNAQLFPEITVGIIGADHMRAGDMKSAIEVMKLVLLAYPDSADANDNLADAYLRDGQKDLARQHAEKALALLDSHSAPASSWSDTEPQRGEIRRSAEKILKKLGEKQR